MHMPQLYLLRPFLGSFFHLELKEAMAARTSAHQGLSQRPKGGPSLEVRGATSASQHTSSLNEISSCRRPVWKGDPPSKGGDHSPLI